MKVIGTLLAALRSEDACHGDCSTPAEECVRTVALVGCPNVGKSVLFSRLTGIYVGVSNYPGTTVEVARGGGRIEGVACAIVDTPGMYSLCPMSEDERVARRILSRERPDVVVHVADAKNLERMLPLTLQLIESGLPVVLALNMMDEARKKGLSIDAAALENELGIPVVPTVSTTGEGIDELREAIGRAEPACSSRRLTYRPAEGVDFEDYLGRMEGALTRDYALSRRAVAVLTLEGDEETCHAVDKREAAAERIRALAAEAREKCHSPMDYLLTVQRRRRARELCAEVVSTGADRGRAFAEKLSRVLVHPATGIPILLLVLYFAFYRFVGVLGAGTAVDFLEGTVFGQWINPHVEAAVEFLIPWPVLQSLFAGEYGIVTLGLRYAVAIILPVVTFFFLVFSVLEDVGYLPRLALLLDRLFKKLGLSGRAVIPMVLGFGCDTMATMVTRTLSSKRERLLAILLLSTAVPCSAQLGVIMALLSGVPWALLTWAGVIGGVYLLVGTVAAQVIPGRPEPFYVEIPPLRLPRLSNIVNKTFARVRWYFREILPLFVFASVIIWVGRLTGLFGLAVRLLQYPVTWVGLPPGAARAFLFGFFRRDYGVAGLYDLSKSGVLSGNELVVGAIALTLFLPCVAHFLVTGREKGWRTTLAISATVVTVSFGTAFTVSWALSALRISL